MWLLTVLGIAAAIGLLIGWIVTYPIGRRPCIFCGRSVAPERGVMDDNGAIACDECAEAEFTAQRAEGFR